MESESDGSSDYSEMELDDTGQWKKVKNKRKRTTSNNTTNKLVKKTQSTNFSQQEINEIVVGNNKNTQQKSPSQEDSNAAPTKTIKNVPTKKSTNFSNKMKEVMQQKHKHLFYLASTTIINRLQMSDNWEKAAGPNTDIIIKTSKGFLLKTNSDKHTILAHINNLKEQNLICSFTETQEKNTTPRNNSFTSTYSAVIASVEQEIEDEVISSHLKSLNIEHRYCKRIISKATNKPCNFVRIITGCIASFEKLLSHGLFYKNRHYPIYASNPPPPTPMPCTKCLQFNHTTDNCQIPTTCAKCKGNHRTEKCTTQLPPKCLACGSEEHAAWSFKCPKRPTKPIEGIPNTQIKAMNKRSDNVDVAIKNNSRVHSPLTIHDLIINTYLNKLNKPKNINREELLTKLRKRFNVEFNIDTTAVFSHNRVYILMFDMQNPEQPSPTQPLNGIQNEQRTA